jgi:WD40 repeat protein
MNATKRKFNTLLQGLSEPRTSYENKRSSAHGTQSTTPIKKTADVDALLEKRRELGLPLSNASALQSPNAKSTNSSSPSFRASSRLAEPTHRAPGFKEPLARFCPGDRNELLKRLATFQELTDWTPKPDRVSEIEWAKRGWVCRGKERVRCVLCNKELVVKLNKQEVDGKEVPVLVSSEIGTSSLHYSRAALTKAEDALIDKYVELVIDSHSEDCLWRKQGCDGELA